MPDELTCESMLAPQITARYTSLGLMALPKTVKMAIGVVAEDGLACAWGPADGTAGAAEEFYIWARVGPEQAEEQIQKLEGSGEFRMEQAPEGTYFINVTGHEGAYLFTDDVLKYAFSASKLSDITWVG